MRYGDQKYYEEKFKKMVDEEKKIKYRDKIRVWLSLTLEDIKETPLGKKIKVLYPEIDEKVTLDELRIMKLFDKVFNESSMKAMELLYKLDGSMKDISVEINFDEIDDNLDGVK